MDKSESTNPDIAKVESKKQMEEQAARVTEITVNDRTNIPLLRSLLEQYRQSNRPIVIDTDQPDDDDVAEVAQQKVSVLEADRTESVLCEAILDVVLSFQENPNRDLTGEPILLPEVAEFVQVMTDIDLSRSAQLPFLLNEDAGIYEPDLKTLFAEAVDGQKGGATFDDIAFAFAYREVRAQVAGATLDTSSAGHVPEGIDSSDLDK